MDKTNWTKVEAQQITVTNWAPLVRSVQLVGCPRQSAEQDGQWFGLGHEQFQSIKWAMVFELQEEHKKWILERRTTQNQFLMVFARNEEKLENSSPIFFSSYNPFTS